MTTRQGEDTAEYVFRDNLWRGELATPEGFRELAEESLGVPVESVTFSELRTDQVYRERLQAAVGDHLEEFNATSAERALTDYLGSSIRVVDGP